MKCNDYIVWISGHIDGTNSPRENASLQDHLKTCADCRRLAKEMESNDRSLKNATALPPLQIAENVMSVVRRDANHKKKRTNRIKSYVFSSVAVAAVLCLVLITSVRMPDKTLESPMVRSAEIITEAADIGGAPAVAEAEYKATRGAKALSDEAAPLHCVFVELPSQDQVPDNYAPAALGEFYTRITKEALDWYYYGGSIVYQSVYMTGEELSQWASMTQTRFIQDDVTSDNYVVVFCSESK